MRTRNPIAAPEEVFGATVSAPSFLSPYNPLENAPSLPYNPLENAPSLPSGGGQGIQRFLTPLLQQISLANQQQTQQKIPPYVQEIEEITTSTFPDAFSGLGNNQLSNPFGALGGILGGLQPRPASDIARPASDIGSNSFIQSRKNMGPYQLSTK
jgi:hypothetical protein|tara:strand:+ start:1546 stop:2010 length:465 start_codon:yes stop_codon:yes gene_type:complete